MSGLIHGLCCRRFRSPCRRQRHSRRTNCHAFTTLFKRTSCHSRRSSTRQYESTQPLRVTSRFSICLGTRFVSILTLTQQLDSQSDTPLRYNANPLGGRGVLGAIDSPNATAKRLVNPSSQNHLSPTHRILDDLVNIGHGAESTARCGR